MHFFNYMYRLYEVCLFKQYMCRFFPNKTKIFDIFDVQC